MSIQRLFCALALMLCAALAQAHDFVSERAWVEDRAGTMTLAEVKQAAETRYDRPYFTQGFSQSTFWLRLRIDPAASPGANPADKLVIRIRPPIQDQIQLFDTLGSQDRLRMTGDYFDWTHDEYRSLNLNFVIPVGAAPRDVWLKLRTRQSTLMAIDVMTEDQVRSADRRQELVAMLYFSVLIVCMGWGILGYINQPDRLVGIYILREIIAISYALVMLGYFRVFAADWLPPAWVDPISNNVVFIFVVYVIWFDSQLIRQFKPNPVLLRATYALTWSLPIEWLLQAFGRLDLAIIFNSYVVLVAIFLVLATALSTRAWRDTRQAPEEEKPVFSKAFLVGVYVLVVVITLVNRLPAMGMIVPPQEGALYLNLLYALLSSICMMALIQIRAYRLGKRQQETQHRTELAQREAESERARRVEQSNFLKMLAHEMKTPLSVVRMAAGNANLPPATGNLIDRAVSDMNGVIERLLEVERLHDQQITLQRSTFDLIELINRTITALPGGVLRIHTDMPATQSVDSDLRLVQVVLSNLLDNALKYSPADAPVHLNVTVQLGATVEQAQQIRIDVESLIGSAGAPDPERVFEKYYRAARAYERTGSGLGLYLVRTLVEMLGGQVTYAASSDYVRFSVMLPR